MEGTKCPMNCYMLQQMRRFRDRVKENRPEDEQRNLWFSYVFPSGIMSFYGPPPGYTDKLDDIVNQCQSTMNCSTDQPEKNQPFYWDMREQYMDFVLGNRCPKPNEKTPPMVPCSVKKDMLAFIQQCASEKDVAPIGQTQCFYDEENFTYAACYGLSTRPLTNDVRELFARIADDTDRCLHCPGDESKGAKPVAQKKKSKGIRAHYIFCGILVVAGIVAVVGILVACIPNVKI